MSSLFPVTGFKAQETVQTIRVMTMAVTMVFERFVDSS